MNEMTADYHRAFKDADIRGIYPKEIDEEVAYFIARAFVDELGAKKVLVARDMRLSSPVLYEAFVRGVNDAGASVIDLGLVHTPLMYFASGTLKLPGVMITASHSPRQYNGFKLVYPEAIPLTEKHGLARIRHRVDKGIYNEPKKRGTVIYKDVRPEYQKFIFKTFKPERWQGIHLAVDVGNGMGSVMMPILQAKAPITCDCQFMELDGTFPNRGSDPTLLKNQMPLRRTLKALPYDFGVAFDGDGDRVAFLDEGGKYINSAIIGALISERLLRKRPLSKIVYTNLTSRIFEESIRAAKGKPVIARVGHAFIKEVMRKKEALFGAEHSGHFYYQDYFYTDSVSLTLLHVLDAYAEAKGKSFSQMISSYQKYHQTEDVIVEVSDPVLAMRATETYIESLHPKTTTHFDGVAVDFGDVWGSVKISVTEYALKMMFESTHKSTAEEMQRKVVKFVQSRSD